MADVAESIELATLDKEMAEEKVSNSSLLFTVECLRCCFGKCGKLWCLSDDCLLEL